MEEKKEMTLEEMQKTCLECAFEIAKLESIKKKYQKQFDDLNYKIWKLQNEKEHESESTPESN